MSSILCNMLRQLATRNKLQKNVVGVTDLKYSCKDNDILSINLWLCLIISGFCRQPRERRSQRICWTKGRIAESLLSLLNWSFFDTQCYNETCCIDIHLHTFDALLTRCWHLILVFLFLWQSKTKLVRKLYSIFLDYTDISINDVFVIVYITHHLVKIVILFRLLSNYSKSTNLCLFWPYMVLQGEAGAQGPDGERGLAGQDVSTKYKVQSVVCSTSP